MNSATVQPRRTSSRGYTPTFEESTDSLWVDLPPSTSTTADAPTSSVQVDTAISQQCWICYDDQQPLVHVCSCTLVGHQDCLLQWLETQAATAPQTAGPKCPVCATPIVVKEEKSEALRLYRKMRRKVDQLSLAAAVGGVTASGWFVASAYGAWVVKVFMGEEVAQALLLRHEGGMPWRYWLNLPIIPFALILSRTPLVDSLLPFLPLTLVLSTHTPRTLPYLSLSDPLGLDDLTLRFPPSPTLTVCLLPWLRLVYLRLRMRVFRAVLGRKKRYRGLAGVFEEAAEDEMNAVDLNDPEGGERRDPLELVAAIEVEVEEGPAAAAAEGDRRAAPQPNGVAHDPAQQPPAAAAAGVDAAANPDPDPPQALPLTSRLRIGFGRLTSLVLGALLFPALSAGAGSALFWLAARGGERAPLRLLRRVLGVSAVVAASRGSGFGGFGGGGKGAGAGTSWIRHLLFSPSSSSSSSSSSFGPSRSRSSGALVDPVWIRNTLGAGLVLLLRDAVELTAGVLENRRRASRKVVERPFNPGSGRATPPTEAAQVSSGGRDGGGREAVVHTLL
ncbi:hypothetical protein JCM6882_000359 [Rhodosporidiobolus microsporus]